MLKTSLIFAFLMSFVTAAFAHGVSFPPRLVRGGHAAEFAATDVTAYCQSLENKKSTPQTAPACTGARLQYCLGSKLINSCKVHFSLPGATQRHPLSDDCLLKGGAWFGQASRHYEISNTEACLGHWFAQLNAKK